MALKLTHYYRLQREVVDYNAVLGHLRDVLNRFLMDGDCTRFYIGISGDLEARRLRHERAKPEFTLMCAIYGEQPNLVDGFQALEAQAIRRFATGVSAPGTGRRLQCTNAASGSAEKRWLYLLVDKRDVSGIPYRRPGDVFADEDAG